VKASKPGGGEGKFLRSHQTKPSPCELKKPRKKHLGEGKGLQQCGEAKAKGNVRGLQVKEGGPQKHWQREL